MSEIGAHISVLVDRTGQPSACRTDVNGARLEELILEDRRVTVTDLCCAMLLYIGTVHFATTKYPSKIG